MTVRKCQTSFLFSLSLRDVILARYFYPKPVRSRNFLGQKPQPLPPPPYNKLLSPILSKLHVYIIAFYILNHALKWNLKYWPFYGHKSCRFAKVNMEANMKY